MNEKALDEITESLLNRKKIKRKQLGDEVDIRVLQSRIIPLLLSPGARDTRFFAGKLLGSAFGKKAADKKGLKEAANIYAKLVADLKFAKPEIIKVSEDETIIRFYESAVASGFENIGMKLDAFEEGFQTGFFSSATGKNYFSVETKCLANGDPYCEFVIRKTTIGEKFAEAFKI